MTQHSFSFPDGRVLSWRETGEGPPLVLLHGWSISGAAFTELAGLLAAKFRVLLPDLPGHGGSSPGQTNSLPSLADDLQMWLLAVESRPVRLAGWSLGGMLAMELATRTDMPLEGLVLIGTTPRFTASDDWPHGLPSGQVKALQRNLGRRFETTLGEFFKLTFAGDTVTPDRLREIRRFAVFGQPLPDRDAATELLQLLAVQDQRADITRIGLPTLVIHGAQDAITPAGAAQDLVDSLSNSRLEVMPRVGHAPFWSAPEQVAQLIEEFSSWAR